MNKIIKKIFSFAGLNIQRINPFSHSTIRLIKSMENYDIDMVLDIGANIGQFAQDIRAYGYTGKIVSFEPLSQAHEKLKYLSEKDPKWTAHSRTAIGNEDGKLTINISKNLVSSSILPMMKSHSSAAKDSVYISTEAVDVNKLDSIASKYIDESSSVFLKIDTQGYEWQVLEGAKETLPKIKGILCELSLTPLYEGQKLWIDMVQYLEKEGFTLWSIQHGFTDARDGRTLQVDATFYRV